MKVVDTTGDEVGPFVDRRELRAAEECRRRSITRKTDISVVVEEANNTARTQQQRLERHDEEMSDADSEGGDDGDENVTETGQEPSQEAAAREEHVSELSRRLDQAINQRIIAAWEQGASLPPEIEQFLKESAERGTLSVGMDLRSVLNRSVPGGYPPPRSPSTSTTSAAAVAPRAAA